MITRVLTSLILALMAVSAVAQNDVSLEINLANPLSPVATWSSTPAGGSCAASGDWSGSRAASGTATLPRVDGDPSYTLTCQWPGNQMTTLTWVNPTQNTDGSPMTNPAETRLVWTQQASFSAFDCLAPAASPLFTVVDRPHPETTHTITTLTPGLWRFGAFKLNTTGLCSMMSNEATKPVVSGVSASSTVSFTVPGAPDLEIE